MLLDLRALLDQGGKVRPSCFASCRAKGMCMLMSVSVRVLKDTHGRVDAVIKCTGKRHLGNLPAQQLAVL